MTPEEKSQLKELMEWKKRSMVQQIRLPLDTSSQQIIYSNVPLFKGPGGSTPTPGSTIVVSINGRDYEVIVV